MLNSSFPTHEVVQEAVEATCTGVGGRLLFHWVSKVFCLSFVLNVFFLPFRIHTFSSGLSQLHCLLVKVIHLCFTVEIASSVVFVFLNSFSKSGSVQTKRQGEMTLLLLYLPFVLGNLCSYLYLTHIRTLLLDFVSSVTFGRAEFPPRISSVISQDSLFDTELRSLLRPGSSF